MRFKNWWRSVFFSIIIVTYNAECTIEKTLKSVLKQTFTDYEIIIKDGESTDSTNAIVESVITNLDNCKHRVELDTGIYDAMNTGLSLASGDYIYFLNSGDVLYSDNVLQKVYDFIIGNPIDACIYHGMIIRDNKEKAFPIKFTKWKWIYLEHAYFSHQAMFCERLLFVDNKFDTSFKICADRDWIIKTLDKGATYKYMEIPIANYEGGGASSGYMSQEKDSLNISRKYGGILAYYFVLIKRKIGVLLGHQR